MGSLRRSDFLRCVPVALWAVACGESPAGGAAATGGKAATGGSASGGETPVSSGGSSGGALAATETGGVSASTGGSSGGSESSSGGSESSSGGATASGGTPSTGGTANGGTSVGGAPASQSCAGEIGASAGAEDFSVNSETGELDSHVLLMSKGDIIRRVMDYTTSGGADHQHEFRFTDDQLVALLAGEGVVIETEGPPLNAANGHTHTVRVHACKA